MRVFWPALSPARVSGRLLGLRVGGGFPIDGTNAPGLRAACDNVGHFCRLDEAQAAGPHRNRFATEGGVATRNRAWRGGEAEDRVWPCANPHRCDSTSTVQSLADPSG